MNFERLTRYLDSLPECHGIPAVDCKITLGYDTVYRHDAGYSDAAKTKPVAPDDLYYLYSATKVITVTAALQLCEQGKLNLHETLDTYLPEYSEMVYADTFQMGPWPVRWPTRQDHLCRAQNPIRILDLFRMTAGMSYDIESAEIQAARRAGKCGTRTMVGAFARMPLLCEPGTRCIYSLAHDVLGGVIESVSGETLGDYFQNHLFEPLGISDMYFTLDQRRQARLSVQYEAEPTTHAIRPVPPTNRYRLTETYESGGAGLICTVDAYSRFVEALSNDGIGATGKRILQKETINEMRKNQLDDRMQQDFNASGKLGYGYGLGLRTLIDPTVSKSPVGEFGWDGAAGAYALMDPKHRIGIFFAEHVLGLEENYHIIHPTLRDLAYEAILG